MSESSIDKSINLGAMGEALNDKMDRDGLNADIKPAAGYGVDYVVEWKAPTESDPSWYRLYASGWIEQGGSFAAPGDSGSNPYTLTYPKAFINTAYYINMAYTNNSTHCTYYAINIRSKTVQSVVITTHCSGTWYAATLVWEAKGYLAT